MVDERYWGRSSTGKRALADSEVRRILELRQPDPTAFLADLHSLANDDPFPEAERTQSHVYVLVKPLSASDDALVALLTGSDARTTVAEILEIIRQERPQTEDGFSPDLPSATLQTRRAMGVGFSSHSAEHPYEPRLIDYVIRWDGIVALICGRGTDDRLSTGPDVGVRELIPMIVLGVVYSTVAIAGRLADGHGAYQGEWTIGVRLDRMRGVVAARPPDMFGRSDRHPYTADEYEQIVRSTTPRHS
jgi:hypothetical protein